MDTRTVTLCSVVPCGLPAKTGLNGRTNGKGMCTRHYARTLKFGAAWPANVRPGGVQRGKYASYNQMHRRVRVARGSATVQACVDCGGQAAEWSYNNSGIDEVEGQNMTVLCKYSLDANQYDPRCRSCHRTFDDHPYFGRTK